MATHGLQTAYEARLRQAAFALGAGGITVIAALLAARCCEELLGPRSAHMATHILVMNVIAPLAACAALKQAPQWHGAADRALVAGFTLQIALFYVWHLPGAATGGALAHGVLHAALLGASGLFWMGIYAAEGAQRWRSFVALTLTGKLVCLLGVLLLFAPRVLDHEGAEIAGIALDDQRMAGLLMLTACPICYLVSAIVIAAKWLRDIETAALRLHAPVVESG